MINKNKQLVKGGLNYFLRQVIVITLNITTALILTRHFSPADFGIIAYITVIGGFIQIISDGGMGLYLIRRIGDIKDKEITEVVIYQIIIFIIIAVFIILTLGINITYYENNNLLIYVLVSSVAIPFSILRSAYFIKLERNLDFASIAIVEIGEQLVFTIVAISLSIALESIWGIVFATVAKAIIGHQIAKRKTKIELKYGANKPTIQGCKRIIGEGISYQIPALLETARSAINPIWIGTLLGTANAGYVDRAVLVAGLPLMFISAIWRKVMFPYFSRIQEDNNYRKSALIKSIYLHSIIDKALYLPLVLFGTELVTIILGEKWIPILPVVYILIAGNLLFASIIVNETAFLLSANKSKVLAKLSIVQLPLAWILTAILIKYIGIIGYAIAAFCLWIFLIIIIKETERILGKIKHLTIQINIIISFLSSVLLMKYIMQLYGLVLNSILHVLAASTVSIILYLFILIIIDRKKLNEIFGILINGLKN